MLNKYRNKIIPSGGLECGGPVESRLREVRNGSVNQSLKDPKVSKHMKTWS